MTFLSILFWIINLYALYYIVMIGWDYLNQKKIQADKPTSVEIFNPDEELQNYIAEDPGFEIEVGALVPGTAPKKQQDKEREDKKPIAPAITMTGGIDVHTLLNRIKNPAEKGDVGLNEELDSLGCEWSMVYSAA